MQPPRIEEIQEFLGHLQYISPFTSKLTIVCQLLFMKLNKGVKPNLNQDGQEDIDKIKAYPSNQ